eukprot:6199680-Pleurochrysis_carterae.AAC.1
MHSTHREHICYLLLASQGRILVISTEHAESVYFCLDRTCTFELPSPINPTFPPSAAAAAPRAAPAVRPVTRTSVRTATSLLPTPQGPLTDTERARFVVSLEHIDNVDRQLMEFILSSINSAAHVSLITHAAAAVAKS